MAEPQSDRPAANQQRRQVFYKGRVQGVGFRYTTLEIAGGYRVSGYVRNLPDGRVGLEAEGEPAELDRFLTSVAERLRRYIVHADCRTRPATGEFDQFEIRH
ncbi:MAG TPA: acylphosphatase [Pirellulales bacterium]|nr:acylphosphatase [Pirellulales bacterium]